MWDTFEATYVGLVEVKRARINTFLQEYEMFYMKQGKTTAFEKMVHIRCESLDSA